MKKLFIILLPLTVFALIFLITIAKSSNQVDENEVYIDASQVTEEEIDSIINTASFEQRTIIVQYEDGRCVRLSPIGK